MRVHDHGGDVDVLVWELGESPLRAVSLGFEMICGGRAHQVDDLVMAG
jgi:hypothetical protein